MPFIQFFYWQIFKAVKELSRLKLYEAEYTQLAQVLEFLNLQIRKTQYFICFDFNLSGLTFRIIKNEMKYENCTSTFSDVVQY